MGIIKNIFQEFGPEYLQKYGKTMPANHKKVINAIINCKTDVYGTSVYQCQDCNKPHLIPLSCGNRHCPNCQYQKTRKWLDKQLRNQLPGPHFMVTFTVPEQIRDFIRSHQEDAYSAMFAAASQALKKLAADPKHIGGDLAGFFGVLHTWGRQLQYHPHIHFIVPGCALDKTNLTYHPSRNDFYLPVIPLGIIYKAKFKDLMKKKGLYNQIPAAAWKPAWNVNCEAGQNISNGGNEKHAAENATKYLAPYVFRVAISDSRIVKVTDQAIVIQYKKKKSNRLRTTKFKPMEFLRRFLQHVLPHGFMKIRYYGFMHPSCSIELNKVKGIIADALGIKGDCSEGKAELQLNPACPHCGGSLIFRFIILPIQLPARLRLPTG